MATHFPPMWVCPFPTTAKLEQFLNFFWIMIPSKKHSLLGNPLVIKLVICNSKFSPFSSRYSPLLPIHFRKLLIMTYRIDFMNQLQVMNCRFKNATLESRFCPSFENKVFPFLRKFRLFIQDCSAGI